MDDKKIRDCTFADLNAIFKALAAHDQDLAKLRDSILDMTMNELGRLMACAVSLAFHDRPELAKVGAISMVKITEIMLEYAKTKQEEMKGPQDGQEKTG